jgi:type IV pilus biogenesis protein CpaD/CtpE
MMPLHRKKPWSPAPLHAPRWAQKLQQVQQAAANDAAAPPTPDLPAQQEPKLRHIATVAVVGLLLTNCTTPPTQYHDVVQHPYELRETAASMDLSGAATPAAIARVTQFAAARPNNGSTFVVTADATTAARLRKAIVAAGVNARDIRLVPADKPVRIDRKDVVAAVAGCTGGPRSTLGIGQLDDGYTHDNANSALLGCAVRRNIAAMIDDPRTLMAAEPESPRDGSRAAAVYGNYSKGEETAAHITLPSPRTATTGVEDGSK